MNYIRQYGLEENRATLELLLVKRCAGRNIFKVFSSEPTFHCPVRYYALASTSALIK